MTLVTVNGSDVVRQWNQKPLLRRFGANSFGENLWRVAWADSRKHLVGGRWRDHDGKPANDKELIAKGHDPNFVREVTEYRWIPLYPGFHGWVIEKWLSAVQFCGTPMSYELLQLDTSQGLLPLPYPYRGEYCEAQKLLMGMEPTISLVSQIINLVRAGDRYTMAEKKTAIVDNLQAKETAHLAQADDIWKNAQGAFHNKPSNVHPGKRTADHVRFKYAAEDVNMPIKQGFFSIPHSGEANARPKIHP